MYTTRIPAHRSRSLRAVSAGWAPWYERPSDALAENFFGPVSLATVCPEPVLMYAALEDAFLCFQRQFETERRFVQRTRDAEEWFFSDDSHWLFSFVSICMVLGLEPEFILRTAWSLG